MNIREAKNLYSTQLNKLREQQKILFEKQKNMQKESNNTSEYEEKNGVILELSNSLEKQIDKTQKFLDHLSVLSNCIHNAQATKQQVDTTAEYTENIAKCMEIARRISEGAKVPYSDERKLMKYNLKLYMAAKNISMMNQSDKEYKSLWEEEEEKNKTNSNSELTDNTEIGFDIDIPELTEIPDFSDL